MVAIVTGANGFIGSAVVRKLVERGEPVRALVRENSNLSNLEGLQVERVVGDLRDYSSLRCAMQDASSLYHVAADYRLWSPDDSELYRSNVTGTDNVISAALAAGVCRIVYTSSVCTIGMRTDGAPSDENVIAHEREMRGAYKKSKFLAEKCAYSWIKRGAPIVIVNPSTPIGPGDIKPTPTGRIILEAARGGIPAFVNTGLNFVHVDDVAAGHLLAHDKGRTGERYILGGCNLSLKSLLWLIADLTDRKPPRIELPRRLLYPVAFAAEACARFSRREPFVTSNGLHLAKSMMYFTSAKAECELDYEHRPVKEALIDALQWFETRQSRHSRRPWLVSQDSRR